MLKTLGLLVEECNRGKNSQQIRARVCGYSIMDRRPIHPPPIVSLCGPDACESRPLVVFTSLWSSDLSVNVSISNNRNQGPTLSYIPGTDAQEYRVIPGEGYILSQMLMGALVTTGIFLLDNQNREGIFFIFKDLAVRSSGLYRLKFELYDPFSKAYGSPPMATVVSDVFQVFSPKTYPGITPTTSLSRCFAQQGAKIRLRPNANIARNDTGGDKTVSPTVDDDH
ncbi:velvet factor [Chytriomyces sp. MP71]|nr:velvet factor [Chytriomyces sp. MP71]